MQRGSGRRPQITDVATSAGVCVSTVSRVMNGNATVAPDLAERVRVAAPELGYQASPAARGLALGRTRTVAVVVPDLTNPGFQDSLRAITAAAARDGYRVLVADTADYRSGIIELARHLHGLGHRRMAYLAGPDVGTSNRLRLAGIAEFLRTHPDTSVEVLPGGSGFADGHAAGSAVRATGATGVLASNDLVAMGLLSALHEAGVQVPPAVTVTGFDDIPSARYTTPPLTTASVPTSVPGEEAWRRLRSVLAGEPPAPDLSLHPRLQARASTGPPPVAPAVATTTEGTARRTRTARTRAATLTREGAP